MRYLSSVVLCAILGLATGQRSNLIVEPCQTKTRTVPHETQCDAYYECYDGQEYVQHCPNGLVYHGKSLTGLFGVCDYAHNHDCNDRPERSYAQLPANQVDPCNHPHGVAGDATYCDRYWECVGDEALLYDCPNGLVFVGRQRGIAEGCDYPWRGPYCQRGFRGEEKKLANPPISTEHCPYLYGIFGHETSCTRYWTCWNGTATEQFCIGGLLYNEETHACDWPQNVQGCQKHPLCKDDPNANVPLGQSCERYWSCQGGYPRLQRCPATLVFDRISRRCVSPPTEECDVPSTTPNPEAEHAEPQFRVGGGPPRRTSNKARRPPPRDDLIEQTAVEQPVEQFVDQPAEFEQRRPQRPNFVEARPRRPNLPSLPNLPNLPNLPHGAIPITFGNNRIRPAPIDGAIPLN